MNDHVLANIKQILSSFDVFVTTYENPSWVNNASTEDIKTAFKLASFVEKTIEHFESVNMLDTFLTTAGKCAKSGEFFRYACDHMLGKLFKHPNVSESVLDIAIRIYTSMLPRQRLENFLSNLLLTASSFEAISSFAKNNLTEFELKALEYRLKLNNWSRHLQKGQSKLVADEIAHYFSIYQIDSSLYLLIGVLSLQDVTESERGVQDIVLGKLLEKMLDRSILSKSFWLTLFKVVEIESIGLVCRQFQEFFISLFNFIVYIGSMMEREDFFDSHVWKSDASISLCPEITYYDVLRVIKHLYNVDNGMKQFIDLRLSEAKDQTELVLWDDIREAL